MFFNRGQLPIRYALKHLTACLGVLTCVVALWFYHNNMRAQWPGVPPVPSRAGILTYGLGDSQFSFRSVGLMLQNLGDSGGRMIPLKDYNYDELTNWFYLSHWLDSRSDYVPAIAAYYFGAVDDPDLLRPLVEYLADVGHDSRGEKWRWLGQAVFLARFKIEDTDLALRLANELAALDDPDLPVWTEQMPAFVMTDRGEQKAALDLMTTIMATDTSLNQNEINFMCYYIDERILEGDKAAALKNKVFKDMCAGRRY